MTVCAGAGCPILLTLSVVGRVELTPADPLDRRVAAAFDAHQRRTTERGRLLGPDAAARRRRGARPARRGDGRPAQPLATGRPRSPAWRRSGSAAGSAPRASSRPGWPPRPASTRAAAWRRREPDSLRSRSTTPTCWSCRLSVGPGNATRARSAAAPRRRSGAPRRASRAGSGFQGKRPSSTNRGARESPTKKGATTSWSSSARLPVRNWVCTLPPPSTISRCTPRSLRSSLSLLILHRLPAVDHGGHRSEARAGVGHPRARAVDELLHSPVAKKSARASSSTLSVTVTLIGDAASPRAVRSSRRVCERTSSRGLSLTDGRRADHDRVA